MCEQSQLKSDCCCKKSSLSILCTVCLFFFWQVHIISIVKSTSSNDVLVIGQVFHYLEEQSYLASLILLAK